MLLHSISHRIARYLLRKGLLEQDAQNSYLTLESLHGGGSAMPDLYGPRWRRQFLRASESGFPDPTIPTDDSALPSLNDYS